MIHFDKLKPEVQTILRSRIAEAVNHLAAACAEQNLTLEFVGIVGPATELGIATPAGAVHIHCCPHSHAKPNWLMPVEG